MARKALEARKPLEIESIIVRLEAELTLQAATIEELQAAGHLTADAERQFKVLQESLSLLR